MALSEKNLANLETLQDEAAVFIQTLVPVVSGATLVTLSGELGAGKTSFTQGVARVLGVEDNVTSPTFVLEKVYELPENSSFKRLIHIDAYRLESGAALRPLGFDELMKDKNNLILLEWPERVADMLPEAAHRITLEVLSDNTRKITYA